MSIMSLRHRPGTHLRSEETRRRILSTALEMFAAQGYEATSTRLLAERADVNPAIPYYFGSKEALYRAVVASCLEHSEAFMAPVKAQALLEKKDALIDALCDIFEHLVVPVSSGDQVEARRRGRAPKSSARLSGRCCRKAAVDRSSTLALHWSAVCSDDCRMIVRRCCERSPCSAKPRSSAIPACSRCLAMAPLRKTVSPTFAPS